MNPMIVLALLLAAAPQSAPLDQPAHVLSREPNRGDYLSPPHQTGPATHTAWSWSISARPDGVPLIDAFLNEYDCATSTFRRLRQERYRGDVLYDTRVSDAAPRPPHWLEMEARIVNEVCRGGYQALPRVESVAAAAAELSVGRP